MVVLSHQGHFYLSRSLTAPTSGIYVFVQFAQFFKSKIIFLNPKKISLNPLTNPTPYDTMLLFQEGAERKNKL
jgi:hypothetical protein